MAEERGREGGGIRERIGKGEVGLSILAFVLNVAAHGQWHSVT